MNTNLIYKLETVIYDFVNFSGKNPTKLYLGINCIQMIKDTYKPYYMLETPSKIKMFFMGIEIVEVRNPDYVGVGI